MAAPTEGDPFANEGDGSGDDGFEPMDDDGGFEPMDEDEGGE